MANQTYEIERERVIEQTRLDAAMAAEVRNRTGQFATPGPLALDIMRFVAGLVPVGQPIRFLEPSIGTGSFFSALRQVAPPDQIESALGFEINADFVSVAKRLWSGTPLEVRKADFTEQSPPRRKFNLLVANPPYVRHHHLDRQKKEELARKLTQVGTGKMSGLAGLYCYFMLLADAWLAKGAISAWLVPSEFMDVNYGKAIRDYLTQQVELIRIHRFCPTDEQFADALVSSAVVIFRKAPPAETATFSFGGSINAPCQESQVLTWTLGRSPKWTRFDTRSCTDKGVEDGPRFGDFFAIKRGLATGNNDFFILSRARAEELNIPRAFLKPILPPPRHLQTDIVEADGDGNPRLDSEYLLLDCRLSATEVSEQSPELWAYLEGGMRADVHTGYLTSRRRPWYSQEDRPSAPFLCTYMGRNRNGKKPFRFIWNRSDATAHNVYLLLYPKGELKAALARKPNLEKKVFEALKALDTASFVGEGRVYGGGLFKMEPKELANVSAEFLTKAIKLPVHRTLFGSAAE